MVIIEKENFSVSQICSSGQCFRLDPADETGKVYELTAGDRYLKIEVAEDQKKVRFYCTQEEFEQFCGKRILTSIHVMQIIFRL